MDVPTVRPMRTSDAVAGSASGCRAGPPGIGERMARREVSEVPREGGSWVLTLAAGCAMLAIVLLFGAGCVAFGALSVLEALVQAVVG